MQQTTELEPPRLSRASDTASPGRLLIWLVALIAVLAVLWLGFDFLRTSGDPNNKNAPPALVNAAIAIVWGVGGIAILFTVANMLVESLSSKWRGRIQPYIFVGPGVLLLTFFLFIPALGTLYQSFFNSDSTKFVGVNNFTAVFTDEQANMLGSIRNNLVWLIIGTGACVVLGLLIAVLADRSRFETVAKALIFLPMAI